MSPTSRVLLALIGGLAGGSFIAATRHPFLLAIASVLEPVGTLWVNAIRMTVIPLVLSLLIVGVTTRSEPKAAGRLGGRALVLFIILLVAGGAFTALVAPPLLGRLAIDPQIAEGLRSSAAGSAAATAESVRRVPTVAQRIVEIVPANAVRAAADGAMLPLIVFTLSLAVALTRISPALRDRLVGVFEALAEAMLVLVGWVLALAPAGVFALALTLASHMGFAAAGALAYYIVVLSAVLLAFTLALYPAVVLLGRVPLRRFAVAVAPAQAVAFSTRSSLAALPAMIAGAKERLGLPAEATGFVLPLAVSVFRVNVPIAWVVGVLFLGQLYGVPFDLAQIGSLVGTGVLLSFSVPGIPSASLFLLAPVLSDVGLPPEGVGILIAVDAIPDMFKTTANVTSHMTAATILARAVEVRPLARPEPPRDANIGSS